MNRNGTGPDGSGQDSSAPGGTDQDAAAGPVVPCPICAEPALFARSNPWRPFCSQRCKLIDLGEWASNGYAVPGDPVGDPADLPTGDGGGEPSDDPARARRWPGH